MSPQKNCVTSFIPLSMLSTLIALSLTACFDNSANQTGSGRSVLSSLRPKADPALVARIREEEQKQAERQAAIVTTTAGAEMTQSGFGRVLPKVSTDPISPFSSLIAPPAETVSANGNINSNNKSNEHNTTKVAYHPAPQLASYESSYSSAAYGSVPPPPPGALGAGLVPPPPAVTLSTQAQAYANNMPDSATAFYNNPYFNPFGVPAPPQSVPPTKRPSGLFGDSSTHSQKDADSEQSSATVKHKADFVPITPKGMEARSPYKQKDDLKALWKGALKESANLGDLLDNPRLIEQLDKQDIGLPNESSKGTFNVSARQIESIFKSAGIDRRFFAQIRKLESELVQAYYRYLYAYNKYVLAEQTMAARKQEVDLADSDSERQRATADLAQSQNDLDAVKDDLHSSEFDLAAASSPAAARSVISRVAGVAPSIEALAQGSASERASARAAHNGRLAGFFDNVLRHQTHDAEAKPKEEPKKVEVKDKTPAKVVEKENKGREFSLFGHRNKPDVKPTKSDTSIAETTQERTLIANKIADNNNETKPAPSTVSEVRAEAKKSDSVNSLSTNNSGSISFLLKNVNVNPRKSVLTVAVKNSGNESFELNPDAIYISEGNHKLASGAIRADFDITSIEPNQEVKGTITVFGRPWNDRLMIYLANGNKTIQLKR